MAHSSSSHREVEGQVHEDTKHALIFKGTKTSDTINEVLKELNQLRAPHAKYWSRRHNEKLNFDNTNSIAFLCNVNNCALFAFGTHNKKRPHNLVMGRTFNGQVLDMVELGIDKHVPVDAKEIGKTRLGSKPLVVFLGAQWRKHDALGRLQNFFLDFFHGGEIDALNLNGIDRLVGITALPPKETPKDEGESVLKGTGYRIHIAHYSVRLNKGAGKEAMDVELTPTGPALQTVIRRTNLAANDVFKGACKRPKQDMKQTVKNVSHDEFGNTRGQIHVQTQDVTGLQTKQFRANRVARKRARAEDRAEKAASKPGVEVEQRQKKRSRKE